MLKVSGASPGDGLVSGFQGWKRGVRNLHLQVSQSMQVERTWKLPGTFSGRIDGACAVGGVGQRIGEVAGRVRWVGMASGVAKAGLCIFGIVLVM